MRIYLWIIFFSATFFSCNNFPTSKQIKRDTGRQGGEDSNLYRAKDDDTEMNDAIRNANNSLYIFNKALDSKDTSIGNYGLKVRFRTLNGGEHIWTTDIKFENGQYTGVINNTPEAINNLKEGDTVRIDKNDISDWFYSENGVLRGGFTIRVIRNRMTKAEKMEFDKSFPYKIED